MLSHLIQKTSELRILDQRASFFIAKELAVIDVNLIWYPEKLTDHIARLVSLAEHIRLTFGKYHIARELSDMVKLQATILRK